MIALLGLATSLIHGHTALVVPLAWCGPCGQDMPVDHDCTRTEAATVRLISDLKTEAAPASTGAAPTPTGDHS